MRTSGSYRQSGLSQEDQRKKQELLTLKGRKNEGIQLAWERDTRADASEPEDFVSSLPEKKKRILEDHDTKRLENREKALKRPRLDPFRI